MSLTPTLFVADLPGELKEAEFTALWQQCSGFVTSRIRQDRNENMVGFVEFQTQANAEVALQHYQGYKFDPSAEQGITIRHSYSDKLRRGRDDDERRRAMVGAENRNATGMRLPVQGDSLGGHQMYGATSTTSSSATPQNYSSFFAQQPFQNSMYPPLSSDAAATLYVEGLPLDATEREVAHIFRPFPGFQSLRILPKESKDFPSRRYHLCFVEYDNKYQATAAVHALQGYRMDKSDIKGLTISFAKTSRRERAVEGVGIPNHLLPATNASSVVGSNTFYSTTMDHESQGHLRPLVSNASSPLENDIDHSQSHPLSVPVQGGLTRTVSGQSHGPSIY